jgi:hypothetical protein
VQTCSRTQEQYYVLNHVYIDLVPSGEVLELQTLGEPIHELSSFVFLAPVATRKVLLRLTKFNLLIFTVSGNILLGGVNLLSRQRSVRMTELAPLRWESSAEIASMLAWHVLAPCLSYLAAKKKKKKPPKNEGSSVRRK